MTKDIPSDTSSEASVGGASGSLRSIGNGRYAVQRVLGEGAQGVTYEATDAQTGEVVAIKRFDVRGARRWKDVEQAEREARVLSTLDHPLVPRYLDHFEDDGALYLVMSRVEGETLESIRKREGALSEAEVRRFLTCADRALTYLHGRASQVVHRDLKPSNVVRRTDGSFVLVDFGAVSDSLRRRSSSSVVGTIGYMAPEQLQGRALPASDVYAVGATALAALTGTDPEGFAHRGLRVDVRGTAKGRASEELIATLERMLEPDPDLRAPSVAAALEPVAARSPSPVLPQAAAPLAPSSEREIAASLRRLLWVLWGIGWVIVPLIFGALLDIPEAIPIVMFGWLALNIVAGWHKNALLRALVRQWNAETATAPKRIATEPAPAKMRVAPGAEEVVLPEEDEEQAARRRERRG
ncbi:MAG TPA: serine/threonine-protein kinase [Polyangiaceae bacterium]|jgi:hypothetical protein